MLLKEPGIVLGTFRLLNGPLYIQTTVPAIVEDTVN